ncbi:tannase/feruloyl esterase family alpha/beta hydrolase [Brenneria sp. hezel4-2-4]|nr:tannase/feruloyl esterase family alpha/beta hydrolase [Brenneria sp. hezel4-2-4]
MSELCQPAALQTLVSGLRTKVDVRRLPDEAQSGPFLTTGVKFTPATNDMPAYCQITGTFVTNEATGKTAHFLATLPENWNRKYLQIGCGGHCGTFSVSNATWPTISISVQGKPTDVLRKGYASFATDEGHYGFTQGKWAVKSDGEIDQDALDDFLYRAHKVLAGMGKQFTTAFYGRVSGQS